MLPRNEEEMKERILRWVEDLNDEIGVVVVEGKKDAASLKNIGVTLPVEKLNRGLSIIEFVEQLTSPSKRIGGRKAYTRIIIMTDWDHRGGRLASDLKRACRMAGVQFDLDHRRDIARITGKWIRDVESLDTVLERISEKRGV